MKEGGDEISADKVRLRIAKVAACLAISEFAIQREAG